MFMKIRIKLLLILFGVLGLTSYAQNLAWVKQIGGLNDESGFSVAVDDSGNVYTTGGFQGTADFDPGAGIYNLTAVGWTDIFVTKLNANGNLVWAKQMSGTWFEEGKSIKVDNSGNVYITGYFHRYEVDFNPGSGTYNLSPNKLDVYIAKLDVNGNFVWAKQIGGPGDNESFSMAIDKTGNIYITGYFYDTVDFDPGAGIYNLIPYGHYDVFVSKLDADGNFIWAKQLGGDDTDLANSVAVDDSGNVLVAGYFKDTADFNPGTGTYHLIASPLPNSDYAQDAFVCKLNTNGEFIWAKHISGGWEQQAFSVIADVNGNVYLTGLFFGTNIDFDPGSGTFNLSSFGNGDIFICKLTATGNFLWAKQMGGTSNEWGQSIAVDDAGNIYTTGIWQGTVDFDPGPGTHILTFEGEYDMFITKFDLNGNFVWVKSIGGKLWDEGKSLTIDDDGMIYAIGSFKDTVDFGSDILISFGSSDVFVTKFSQTTTLIIDNKNIQSNEIVFPNPAQSLITVTSGNNLLNSIELFDVTGRLTLEVQGNNSNTQIIDLSKYQKGIYFVKVKTNNGGFTSKIIKY